MSPVAQKEMAMDKDDLAATKSYTLSLNLEEMEDVRALHGVSHKEFITRALVAFRGTIFDDLGIENKE